MKKTDLPFRHEEAKDSTGFLLWQVTALWQREISSALRPIELTQVQFVLLAGLIWLSAKEKLITQAMLAKHTKVDTMTTSQVLRTLEAKGYVGRQPHPNDTRANILQLTPAGKKVLFQAIPEVDRVDENFFSIISGKLKHFNSDLQKLIDKSEQP